MSDDAVVNGDREPVFFDAAEVEAGRNGAAATAQIMNRVAVTLNQLAHAGRPFYSFVTLGPTSANVQYRQVYQAQNYGAGLEGGLAIWLTHPFDPDGQPRFQTGQGVKVTLNSTDYTTPTDYDLVVDTSYPEDANVTQVSSYLGYSATPTELVITQVTTNSPQIRALTLWQSARARASASANSVVGKADLHQKGDIIGTRAAGNEQLASMMRVFINTAEFQRPQIGWSASNPGSANYVAFTTSKTAYRYIFDQTCGLGATSFTVSTPGMTFPLRYAAAGRRTQVRVYVFVYAAMSGATNTGTVAVANKNSGGTMASTASALTNGLTINSTTFKWYPLPSAFNPATSPYFLGYAGSTPDRVALCAKSSGTTDAVRIAAWTLMVQHVPD